MKHVVVVFFRFCPRFADRCSGNLIPQSESKVYDFFKLNYLRDKIFQNLQQKTLICSVIVIEKFNVIILYAIYPRVYTSRHYDISNIYTRLTLKILI